MMEKDSWIKREGDRKWACFKYTDAFLIRDEHGEEEYLLQYLSSLLCGI